MGITSNFKGLLKVKDLQKAKEMYICEQYARLLCMLEVSVHTCFRLGFVERI